MSSRKRPRSSAGDDETPSSKKAVKKEKDQSAVNGPEPKTENRSKAKSKSKVKEVQKTCLDQTLHDNNQSEPLVFENPDGTEYEEMNSVEKSK